MLAFKPQSKIISALVLILMLSGCSTTSFFHANTVNKKINSHLYDQEGIEVIINNIRASQSSEKLKAWRKVHNVNGKSDSDTEKKFAELNVNSERAYSYYTNASTIRSYLYTTPCKVIANDNVTLVVIPNTWIWGGSYNEISIVSKPYLKELGQFIGRKHYSAIIQSYLNNDEIIINKGSLSSSRAEALGSFLGDEAGYSIPSVGLGGKFDLEPYMVNSTIVELRPTQAFDSSKFTPKETVNEFDWNE